MPVETEINGTTKAIERVTVGAWIKTFNVEGDDNGTWSRVYIQKSLIGDQTGRAYTELHTKTRDGLAFMIREANNTPVESLTAKQATKAGLAIT